MRLSAGKQHQSHLRFLLSCHCCTYCYPSSDILFSIETQVLLGRRLAVIAVLLSRHSLNCHDCPEVSTVFELLLTNGLGLRSTPSWTWGGDGTLVSN